MDHNNLFIADEILKLKQLLDSGIITETEFNRQKDKLLGSIDGDEKTIEEKTPLEIWREQQTIASWKCPLCGAPNNSSICSVCHYDPSKDHTRRNENSKLVCPKCGSTAITTGQRGWKWTTGFLGSGQTVNRCGHCGYSWRP